MHNHPVQGHLDTGLVTCKHPPIIKLIYILIGMSMTLAVICLTQPQSPLVFTARSCGNFSFWHWNPGLGRPLWGLVPPGTSATEISLLILNHHTRGVGPAVPCLCASYQSRVGHLINIQKIIETFYIIFF